MAGAAKLSYTGKIVTAIHTQQLTAELLVGVKPCSFTDSDRKKLCFIGSMSYLNVMLSEMLLDIVRHVWPWMRNGYFLQCLMR